VRLANFHRAGELEALLDSQQGLPDPDLPPRRGGQPPGEPGEEQPPDGPPRRRGGRPSRRGRAQDELPAAVKPYYEQRSGYANYWFNRYHQQRVWNAYLAHGDFADAGWNWKIRGQLAADGEVEIVLSENHAAIVMPQGRSEAEFGPSLSGEVGPPRSGGLLAALHLWQRLLVVGPRRFGEIHYVGTLPWKSDADLDDCLAATYGGVVAHLFFDPQTGHIVGLEMSLADDQDPCEIYFSDVREVQGRMLPHRWLIRHGDEEYADLQITAVEWKAAEATGSPSDK
jgi:hypothetical protein